MAVNVNIILKYCEQLVFNSSFFLFGVSLKNSAIFYVILK